jgi:hypothetical protein
MGRRCECALREMLGVGARGFVGERDCGAGRVETSLVAENGFSGECEALKNACYVRGHEGAVSIGRCR